MLTGSKVLVTGATGCIGGRLVEKLVLYHGVEVRVLVRNLARAIRLSRFRVEMVRGDITDADAIAQAVSGCDVVIHCAHDFGDPNRNLMAASLLAEASLRHNIEGFVHVSTKAVYKPLAEGYLDESFPEEPYGWTYADNKLAVERELLRYWEQKGLPVVVLQPTTVYGPFSNWTLGPVQWLKTQRVVLPDAGEGQANAVYVDDVVDALILAARQKGVEGERFLVSGSEPVSWRQFYAAYERLLGTQSLTFMPAEQLEKLTRQQDSASKLRLIAFDPRNAIERLSANRWLAIRFLYSLARRCVSDSLVQKTKRRLPPPLLLPDPHRLASYRSASQVKSDKARKLLGYQPSFDLSRGMELTASFLRWANLV